MRRDGFVALVSSVIISLVAMAVVFSASFSGFFARNSVSANYTKEISAYLSESCVHTAMLKLQQDIDYAGNETITIGSDNCTIRAVQTSGSNKTVQTRALFERATTNYEVVIDTSNWTVSSWKELTNF